MLNRRELLQAALASMALPAYGAETLPEADLSRIRSSQFTGADLDLPYYLAHFARLANGVRMEEPNRGFIDLAVWRAQKDNQPYNARVMENILSLAWFYSTGKSWNTYRGNAALRQRLEAALDFWCRIPSPDGRYSEYKPQGWNLAATAFATKFMAEALRLLKGAPPIDPAIHKRAIEACRKAIRVTLSAQDLFDFGRDYSNQYTNVFAGAPAFLALYPDRQLEEQLYRRMREAEKAFQSPAGYFYEAGGPDFGYNLGTHHHNARMAWHYFRNSPWADYFARQEDLFCEWLAYNARREPGEDFWSLNRAIECRQRKWTVDYLDTPVAELSKPARAFATPPQVGQSRAARLRQRLAKEWPKVAPLPVGEFWAFSPYTFLHRNHYSFQPTREQIEEAARSMSAWRETPFVHERADSRHPLVFHYTRQQKYYAAFASGPALRPQQRLGLTYVWTPRGGAVLQSQTGGKEDAWGALDEASGTPFEAARVTARFDIDGQSFAPKPGARDLAGRRLRIRYDLPGGGAKTVEFLPDRVRVSVDRPGEWIETLPMLVKRGEQPRWRVETQVEKGKGARLTVERRPSGGDPLFGRKLLAPLRLRGQGRASYEIRF